MKETTFHLNFQGCETPGTVGDGYCDDHVHNAECNYDGGECCGSNVNTYFCADCVCYSQHCDGPQEFISDGYCNDETNNADCNYDGRWLLWRVCQHRPLFKLCLLCRVSDWSLL